MTLSLTELAGGVSSASLCDALSVRHDHRCHLLDLVSPTPDRVLFGPAVTMQFLSMRRDRFRVAEHDFARVLRAAAAGAPAGSVLVTASGGCPEAALAGGKKLALARIVQQAPEVTSPA